LKAHLSNEIPPVTLDDIICLDLAVQMLEMVAVNVRMVTSFQPVFAPYRQNH